MYWVRHEFLLITKNKNYAKMAHFSKYANRYKYFQSAFVLLQARFGSSTSPDSAIKDVNIKRHQILLNAPLRHPDLRQRLTRCRDRRRWAWCIICVPFWAVTNSLCVSISLFLPLPPSLPYNRTDFGQYISAWIVWSGLILGQKRLPKKYQNQLFLNFLTLSTVFCVIFPHGVRRWDLKLKIGGKFESE